jgi:hypothetical protein
LQTKQVFTGKHSLQKRKADFPFAFLSFFRNFGKNLQNLFCIKAVPCEETFIVIIWPHRESSCVMADGTACGTISIFLTKNFVVCAFFCIFA